MLTSPPAVIGSDQQVHRAELRHLESPDALLKFLAADIDANLRREFQRLLPPEIALEINSRQLCKAIKSQIPSDPKIENEAAHLRDHIFNLVVPKTRWLPVESLLTSGPEDRHFVVELDDLRRAEIRFGDGVNGARPRQLKRFYATFSISNLSNGNIGPNLVRHIVTSTALDVSRVWNPLPISGAQQPEDTAEIQQNGPGSVSYTHLTLPTNREV